MNTKNIRSLAFALFIGINNFAFAGLSGPIYQWVGHSQAIVETWQNNFNKTLDKRSEGQTIAKLLLFIEGADLDEGPNNNQQNINNLKNQIHTFFKKNNLSLSECILLPTTKIQLNENTFAIHNPISLIQKIATIKNIPTVSFSLTDFKEIIQTYWPDKTSKMPIYRNNDTINTAAVLELLYRSITDQFSTNEVFDEQKSIAKLLMDEKNFKNFSALARMFVKSSTAEPDHFKGLPKAKSLFNVTKASSEEASEETQSNELVSIEPSSDQIEPNKAKAEEIEKSALQPQAILITNNEDPTPIIIDNKNFQGIKNLLAKQLTAHSELIVISPQDVTLEDLNLALEEPNEKNEYLLFAMLALLTNNTAQKQIQSCIDEEDITQFIQKNLNQILERAQSFFPKQTVYIHQNNTHLRKSQEQSESTTVLVYQPEEIRQMLSKCLMINLLQQNLFIGIINFAEVFEKITIPFEKSIAQLSEQEKLIAGLQIICNATRLKNVAKPVSDWQIKESQALIELLKTAESFASFSELSKALFPNHEHENDVIATLFGPTTFFLNSANFTEAKERAISTLAKHAENKVVISTASATPQYTQELLLKLKEDKLDQIELVKLLFILSIYKDTRANYLVRRKLQDIIANNYETLLKVSNNIAQNYEVLLFISEESITQIFSNSTIQQAFSEFLTQVKNRDAHKPNFNDIGKAQAIANTLDHIDKIFKALTGNSKK